MKRDYMFDKTFITPTRTERIYERTCPEKVSVEINENRAPTDESVKILNEMLEKAESNLVIRIAENFDNRFHVEYFVFKRPLDVTGTLYVQVKVNGKVYQRRVRLTERYDQYFNAVKNGESYDLRLMKYMHLQTVLLISEVLIGQKDYTTMLSDAVSRSKGAGELCWQTLTDKLEEGEFDSAKYQVEHFQEYSKY